MNKTIISLIVCLMAAISASAQTKDYTLTPGDFNELKVTGNINVDYRQSADSAGYVCFTAPQSVASIVTASVKKGRMRIEVIAPEGQMIPDNLPTVTVYSSSLLKVENEGDSTVRVLSSVPVPTFSARLIGNGALIVRNVKATSVDCSLLTGHGRIVTYGSCTDARFNLAGTGIIQADGLKAVNATCFATGTGDIGVNAENIKVRGAGSGTIFYTGNPQITKSFAIGVKVLPIEE